MNQKPDKQDRLVLLVLAAEGVADAIPGCADRIQAPSARPRISAIDHFGPLILGKWNAWLQARDVEEQKRALVATANLDAKAAAEAVADWFQQHPAAGSP